MSPRQFEYISPAAHEWSGGAQRYALWESGPVRAHALPSFLSPFAAKTELVGCGPAAFVALLEAEAKAKNWTISGPKDEPDALRRFAHDRGAGRPRLTEIMRGRWLRSGVLVLPWDFERGARRFLNEHVRKENGEVPRLVGGWKGPGQRATPAMLTALVSASRNNSALLAGYALVPLSRGAHYSVVTRAVARLENERLQLLIESFDDPAQLCSIGDRADAFGGLWTLE